MLLYFFFLAAIISEPFPDTLTAPDVSCKKMKPKEWILFYKSEQKAKKAKENEHNISSTKQYPLSDWDRKK